MNKLINRLTAILVLMFIVPVSAATLWKSRKNSSDDDVQSVAGNAYGESAAAEYFNELMTLNFLCRDKLVGLNANIREELGEGIVNGVLVSGNMLLDTNAPVKNIPDSVADEINRFAKEYKGAVYFTAVPTSAGVYGEKLPPYFVKNAESQQINALYESLDQNIRKIDACNILKTHANNYIYYRSDTKWTSYGAYCVYRTVIQKLGFTPAVYDKYNIRHLNSEFRGNLHMKTGCVSVKADIIDAYDYSGGSEVTSCTAYDNDGTTTECALYDKALLDSDYMYDVYLGRETPLLKIRTDVKNERKLLVIKDSCADCFVPFLTQHYSEIAVVSPDMLEVPMTEMIDLDEYDQTLFVFGIESLGSSRDLKKINT